MRIAIVHSFYAPNAPSGENEAVKLQIDILRSAGHEVLLVATESRVRPTLRDVVSSGIRVASGIGSSPLRLIRDFAPDVIHVHNLFPNFGTHWLSKADAPIVTTVHNYRYVCAAATLFRDGQVCTLCPEAGQRHSVWHRCYRDSVAATIPIAIQNTRGLTRNPVFGASRLLVCPSSSTRRHLVAFGAKPARLRVVPSPVPAGEHIPGQLPRADRWLVVARATPEKGIAELLRIWPSRARLDIIGSTAEETVIPTGKDVRCLGQLPRQEILRRMPAYNGLVFPSLSYETQGLVLAEACASGLPVVVRNGNVGVELVSEHNCGLVYDDEANLIDAMTRIQEDRVDFSLAARRTYEAQFTEASWLASIEAVYKEVI